MNVNRVVLVGHATRAAKISYLPDETPVADFAVAINSRAKVGGEWTDRADYFDCVLYGSQAAAAGQYLTKGRQIAVSGRLRQERWEDKDTKKTRSKVRIVVSDIEYVGRQTDAGEPTQTAGADLASASDDDIPF